MSLEFREFSATGSEHHFGEHEVKGGEKQNVAFGAFTTMDPEDGSIRFDGSCAVGDHVHICGAGGVVIEDGVTIDAGVTIMSRMLGFTEDGSERRVEFSRVRICRNAHIGARAVILPGVIVGAGAVVMPGAVVVSDVPENGVAVTLAAQMMSGAEEEAPPEEPAEQAPADDTGRLPPLIGQD